MLPASVAEQGKGTQKPRVGSQWRGGWGGGGEGALQGLKKVTQDATRATEDF